MALDTNNLTLVDDILTLECGALDRWGNGDPGGFLELYAEDVSYFDPQTAIRVDGHAAMVEYYRPWIGQIHISRYEMLNPQVLVNGDLALLSYNLVNYNRDEHGSESVVNRWNSTSVYRHRAGNWKLVHSHWSFTSSGL